MADMDMTLGTQPQYGRKILHVEGLKVYFGERRRPVRAVDGVTFTIFEGECVGLVGESGCGKSTLGRAILRLEESREGQIIFKNQDVLALEKSDMVAYREEAQMVFQDPYGSLNPRITIGAAIVEVLKAHRVGDRRSRREIAGDLLVSVGLDSAYMDRYPHEFSGGQRQRIGIARALAVSPSFLIADEPVSALDVSVQVQILNLLKDLQKQRGLTYLFVAHDLAVVRYICDRVLVMYLGRIVESASSSRLYTNPSHPYTRALLAAVPDVDKGLKARGEERKSVSLKGDVPSPMEEIKGCAFHTRCPFAKDICRHETPPLTSVGPGHEVACHFADDFVNESSLAVEGHSTE